MSATATATTPRTSRRVLPGWLAGVIAAALVISIVVLILIGDDGHPEVPGGQQNEAQPPSPPEPYHERDRHVTVAAGDPQPIELAAGHNHLTLMPLADTGCMVAPEPADWFVREDHDDDIDRHASECREEKERKGGDPDKCGEIRVWANCHFPGGGVRAYTFSNIRPETLRVYNHSGDVVYSWVYTAPNDSIRPPRPR